MPGMTQGRGGGVVKSHQFIHILNRYLPSPTHAPQQHIFGIQIWLFKSGPRQEMDLFMKNLDFLDFISATSDHTPPSRYDLEFLHYLDFLAWSINYICAMLVVPSQIFVLHLISLQSKAKQKYFSLWLSIRNMAMQCQFNISLCLRIVSETNLMVSVNAN